MKRVLLTGMSGTGKSTLIAALAARGYPGVDMDEPGWSEHAPDGDWVWREDRVQEFLAQDEESLRAPQWDRPPVWFHGDLLRGNLLVTDGRLSAVIDWGGLGVGDPACDLMCAWGSSRARAGRRSATPSRSTTQPGPGPAVRPCPRRLSSSPTTSRQPHRRCSRPADAA